MRKSRSRPLGYYVYILFDWLGIPRYVGKGNGQRDEVHEKKSSPFNQLKNEFIEQTWIMLEEIPKIRVRENLNNNEACLIEIALIKAIGRLDLGTGPLTNMTAGGDGFTSETAKGVWSKFTPEERSEIIRQRNAKRTPEQRSESARLGKSKVDRKVLSDAAKLANEIRWSGLTFEQRRDELSRGCNNRTPEQRVAASRLGSKNQTPEDHHNNALQSWVSRRERMQREGLS